MPTTKYLWDDETDSVVMEKDGSGTTQAVYTTEPEPFGRLVSMRRGGKTYNYIYDGLGSTAALADENGQITDTYRYDAWGNERAHTGTTTNPYRFVGEQGYQYNETTSDYYVRERVYEPKDGRWLSLVDSRDEMQYAYSAGRDTRTDRRATAQPRLDGTVVLDDSVREKANKDMEEPKVVCPLPINPGDPVPRPFCHERTNWTPEMCPCPCRRTKVGSKPVTAEQLQTMFRTLSGAKARGVTLTVAARTCVPRLGGVFALTCPPRSTASGRLFLCVPSGSLSFCQARALLIHELTHVQQILDRSRLSAVRMEQIGYGKQCGDVWEQHCGEKNKAVGVPGNVTALLEVNVGGAVISGSTKKEFITDCVKKITRNSTSVIAQAAFKAECRRH